MDRCNNDASCGLFAVFDGHGGRQVSDHLQERFPAEFKKELAKNPGDLSGPLTSIFTKLDNELRLIDSDGCGSTACVCVIRKEGNASILYVANVGDTRCVLGKNSGKEA